MHTDRDAAADDGASSADGASLPEATTGPRFARLTIASTLEAATVELVGAEEGLRLAQVVKRTLVWWMNLTRDLWPRDRIDIVYELRGEVEPIVYALWLESAKLGGARAAVLYKPSGAEFARYYDEDGREIELRLKDGPLATYEQVTSLLSDGRGHRGVDFKTPVGTPVLAPFAGVVVRRNWSRRRNGNCLEIQDSRTALRAIFLHLDRIEPSMRPGARVRKGQVLARSGNTGRSSAPHLHYQMEIGERVVDPFKVHRTWRGELAPPDKAAVQGAFREYGAMRLGST